MNQLFTDLTDTAPLFALLQPQAAGYLLVVLLVMIIGKKVDEWLSPYDLNEQLTVVDNKAVALSFAGYLFGLGLILWGVMASAGEAPEVLGRSQFYGDCLDILLWGMIGIVFLQLARVINDKVLLSSFNNVKELIKDRNIGTGAVECGTFIGSALIIRAAIMGDDYGFGAGLLSSLIFFVCGQVAFILYGLLYQRLCRYDLHAEIEQDNIAAGVAFGMSLIAIGILLADFIARSDSLAGLMLWFVISVFLLMCCRYLVNKLIIPGRLLDEEISRDHNWGAALIEGGAAIALALLLGTVF